MAVYKWEGVNRTGQAVKGSREAPSEAAVVAYLRQNQIRPKKVRKQMSIGGGGGRKKSKKPGFFSGVGAKDLVVFSRQFATMIDAGLPLVQCLEILSGQQKNPYFGQVIRAVKLEVEGGSTFADALKKHPKVFDDLYVNLVAAGEVGGILDTIFLRLSAYLEKSMKLAQQVKGAMFYPISIAVGSGISCQGWQIRGGVCPCDAATGRFETRSTLGSKS